MDHARHSDDDPSRRRSLAMLAAVALLVLAMPGGVARADRSTATVADLASAFERGIVTAVQEGIVSWYGAAFHDRPTASGERFDSNDLTMAHPTLPFGTEVLVTNLRNGRSVIVRVNDRGPFVGKRIADLSRAAAAQLGFLKRGVARARIEVLDDSTPAAKPAPAVVSALD
jgi:rare lipoprotein A